MRKKLREIKRRKDKSFVRRGKEFCTVNDSQDTKIRGKVRYKNIVNILYKWYIYMYIGREYEKSEREKVDEG